MFTQATYGRRVREQMVGRADGYEQLTDKWMEWIVDRTKDGTGGCGQWTERWIERVDEDN